MPMSTKVCNGCHEEKNLESFGLNRSKKDGRQTQCKDCRNKYASLWYSENKEVHKKRAEPGRRKALKRNREALWGILSDSSCVDCGESNSLVLEFDHLHDKEAGVASLHGGSLKRLLDEVAKCDIVCANCHRLRTYSRSGCWRIDLDR